MTEDQGVAQGVHVAAITPRGKQGDIDFGATFELIDFLCATGADGIALFTTTGEFPALAADERSRVVYLAAKRSRVPVLVGVGSATADLSLTLAREARDAGAAALLVPPPNCFLCQQDEIREFYLQFAAHLGSSAPIILTNATPFPSGLDGETSLSLLGTGLFAGVEDASGDLAALARLQAAAGKYTVLSGHDGIFTRARRTGVRAAISPAACAVPELVMALDRAITAGSSEIDRLDAMLQQFLAWTAEFPGAMLVKAAAGFRGLKTGPPPVPLSPARQARLDEFREWFQGWLPAVKQLAVHA
jgi:4-hydroxy-tetrahydrodipicolinate synthase